MKKTLALLLVLALVLAAFPALADDSDFSTAVYEQYDTLFTITEKPEDAVSIVETLIDVEDVSFVHKYESEHYYSFIRSDLLVLDYNTDNRCPVFRTWIYYSAEEPLHFHSVQFEIDGKTYLLTGINESGRVDQRDHGICEPLQIIYGVNNADFFVDVLWAAAEYLSSDEEDKAVPQMKMTLIGDETIEVMVPDMFWIDFGLLGLPFLTNDFAWLAYVGQTEGTACELVSQ